MVILVYGLLNSYTSGLNTTGEYVSDTSAIYEYCILFFLLTWYYAGKCKIRRGILLIYSGIYVLLSILHGDRSSAFPMILLVVLLYFPQISIKKMFFLAFAGIFASNVVSVYRNNYTLNNFFEKFMYNLWF